MSSEDDVLQVIDLAYAAVEEPVRWEAFLGQFASRLRGTVATIAFEDFRAKKASISAVTHADPSWMAMYESYYAARNPFLSTGMPPADVVTGEMIIPNGDLVRTEYYNDFLRPNDMHHLLASALSSEANATMTHLTVMRPSRVGPYEEEAVRFFGAVVPHLKRALQIHQRLVASDLKANAVSGALDQVPQGVVLVGEGEKVIGANRAAREILNEADGLLVSRGELTSAHGAPAQALQKALSSAVAAKTTLGAVRGGTFLLPRRSGRPLEVSVAPTLLTAFDGLGVNPRTILFVVDPEREMAAVETVLADLYRLTPAEARLAGLLASGQSLAQAATEFRVSIHTVRVQLKSLFGKTGTGRQGEPGRTLRAA